MQVVLDGVINGLPIALLAVAFAVVYLPTRVFHIGLAAVYAAVPYIAWALARAGCAWYVAIPAAIVSGGLLCSLCELLNHSWLARRGAPAGTHLVSSLGIYIVVVHTLALAWGSDPRVLDVGTDAVFRWDGLILTHTRFVVAVVAVALLAVFYLWLKWSRLGLQFRALASNPSEMALRGHDIYRLRLIAFGLSGLLASTASLLVAVDLSFDPQVGLPALLMGIVAMIIGGNRSFAGPAIGGVLLGLLRAEVIWFLSARWQEVVTFVLLAAFLLLRPAGLLGNRARLESEA